MVNIKVLHIHNALPYCFEAAGKIKQWLGEVSHAVTLGFALESGNSSPPCGHLMQDSEIQPREHCPTRPGSDFQPLPILATL